MKKAIAVISLGRRSWINLTYPTVYSYAKRVGATPLLLNTKPSVSEFSLPWMSDSPGRSNKYVYALKAFYPGILLQTYDKVAIVDDSCIITKHTPDIFDLLSPEHVAAVLEPELRGVGAYKNERRQECKIVNRYLRLNGLPEIQKFHAYVNTGVMFYDRSKQPFFELYDIINMRGLLFSKFADQTLINYLLQKNQTPIQLMEGSFNCLNIFKGDRSVADIRKTPLSGAYIYHVTSWWRRRCEVMKVLFDRLNADEAL